MPDTKPPAGLPTDEELEDVVWAVAEDIQLHRVKTAINRLRSVRDRTEAATKSQTLRWAADRVLANGLLPMDVARLVAHELREAAEGAERG